MMHMDDALRRHKEVIETLRGMKPTGKVNEVIKSMIGPNNHSDIFMVKNELNRLLKPSMRPFRIEQYFHEQISHYTELNIGDFTHHVDELTERKLKNELARFHGIYTVGAEEAMAQFVKDNKEQILHFQVNRNTSIIALDVSETIYRKEERMHLGVRCEIYRVNKRKIHSEAFIDELIADADKIKGLTQNISFNGLRLRSQQPGKKGEFVLVRFTGLEKDFVIGQPYVLYECVFSERGSRNQNSREFPHSWALRKIERQSNNEFNAFSKKLIRANKQRLSVDMDNVVRAVTNNITEQFITNREQGLSLFIDDGGPSYCLGNNMGRELFDFFSVSNKPMLASLLKKDSGNQLPYNEPVIWCVIKQKDEVFFSAFLTGERLNLLFSHYCFTRDDAYFFQVTRTKANKEGAFSSHSLPATSSMTSRAKQKRRLTDFYSDNTRDYIDTVREVYFVDPIDKDTLKGISPEISKSDFSQALIKKFSEFSAGKRKPDQTRFVKVRGRELRKEDRFVMQTPVSIDIKGETYHGQLRDVSESGAALVMSGTFDHKVSGRKLKVKFPYIEPIGSIEPTSIYQVVRQDNNQLFLYSAADNPNASFHFWAKYLDRHFSSLDPVQEVDQSGRGLIGVERALRNIKNASTPNIQGLIQPLNKGSSVSSVNIPKNASSQLPVDRSKIRMNVPSKSLKNVFCDHNTQTGLSRMIRKVTQDNPFEHHILMVGTTSAKDSLTVTRSALFMPGELNLAKLRILSKKMKRRGERASWFLMSVTRKSKVFDKYYREELDYIDTHATHRADALYSVIKQTTGVFSLQPLNTYIDAVVGTDIDRQSTLDSVL